MRASPVRTVPLAGPGLPEAGLLLGCGCASDDVRASSVRRAGLGLGEEEDVEALPGGSEGKEEVAERGARGAEARRAEVRGAEVRGAEVRPVLGAIPAPALTS